MIDLDEETNFFSETINVKINNKLTQIEGKGKSRISAFKALCRELKLLIEELDHECSKYYKQIEKIERIVKS